MGNSIDMGLSTHNDSTRNRLMTAYKYADTKLAKP